MMATIAVHFASGMSPEECKERIKNSMGLVPHETTHLFPKSDREPLRSMFTVRVQPSDLNVAHSALKKAEGVVTAHISPERR